MLRAIHSLPTGALRTLAASLRAGLLSAGLSRYGIQQAAGADAAAVEGELHAMATEGFTPRQMGVVLQAIVDGRESQPDASSLFDLVLSGPDVREVPTADTAAVMHTLVTQATKEVLLVGYAVYNGRELFRPLAERMESIPDLEVTFCLDIGREYGETSTDHDIVNRFAREFVDRHWPWKKLPKVFYDPRALVASGPGRASLHAKCVVVDSVQALVTSANFTEAAQNRNIEAGVLIRHHGMSGRIARYFSSLIENGQLLRCRM